MVTTADGERDDNQQHQYEGYDAGDLHPARRAMAWSGVRGRVSHRPGVYETLCLWQIQRVYTVAVPYSGPVPQLWSETIEAHRRDVRDAILDTAAALVADQGLRSVTMSRIAEETGIGRATLYKYFPGIDAILVAWHERQIASHLQHLADVRDEHRDPGQRLGAVLEAYALISHQRHGTELAAFLHRGEHVSRAQQQLTGLLRELLTEAAESGQLRSDIAPDELASYCRHALGAASSLPSKAAVSRLVRVTLAGLQPSAAAR